MLVKVGDLVKVWNSGYTYDTFYNKYGKGKSKYPWVDGTLFPSSRYDIIGQVVAIEGHSTYENTPVAIVDFPDLQQCFIIGVEGLIFADGKDISLTGDLLELVAFMKDNN